MLCYVQYNEKRKPDLVLKTGKKNLVEEYYGLFFESEVKIAWARSLFFCVFMPQD